MMGRTNLLGARCSIAIGVFALNNPYSFKNGNITVREKRFVVFTRVCSIRDKVSCPPKNHRGSQPMGLQIRDDRQMKA